MAKAILSIIREDIKLVAGPLQLCACQMAGVEAAIHSVCELFVHDDCDAVLLVRASNAFNSLNRLVALHNCYIRQLCPRFAPILINFIGFQLACLFQVMCYFQRKILLDDACAGGKLCVLQNWWDELRELGPRFRYFVNAAKTWLPNWDNPH